MTDYIIDANRTSELVVNETDMVWLKEGIDFSSANFCINAVGQKVTLKIDGNLHTDTQNYSAIRVLDRSHVQIGGTGKVYGYGGGISVGSYSTLTNAGEIKSNGIALAATGTSTIVNSGVINGQTFGIRHYNHTTHDKLDLKNSGLIKSAGTAVEGSKLDDIIINTGHIEGTIALLLDAGHDTYDGRNGGTVVGLIDLGEGNDTAYGGEGEETFSGGAGDDKIYGGGGNDTLYGDADNDTLDGGSGNDILDGGTGNDELNGGEGNDTYVVNAFDDKINEGNGSTFGRDTVIVTGFGWGNTYTLGQNGLYVENVTIADSVGAIKVIGDAADNILEGNSSNNTLEGAGGNDTLNGGDGEDELNGGSGNDIYYVDKLNDKIVEDETPGSGSDTVIVTGAGWGATYILGQHGANVENVTLDNSVGTIKVFGNNVANVLRGNGSANTLEGAGGDDILDGGDGVDELYGGEGNDIYYVDKLNDTIIELATPGSGNDTVVVTGIGWGDVYTLGQHGANVENITLDNSVGTIKVIGDNVANILKGNGFANTLEGAGGDDILDGGDGVDELYGGEGNDTYYVTNAGEKVVETAAGGTADHVYTKVSHTLATYVERLTASGSSSLSLTGNTLANTITGNTGHNTLNGGLGHDTLKSGAGHDTLNGGSGKDTLYGSTGKDVFVFDAKLKSSNVDKIGDYSKKDDSIYLENRIFTKLTRTGTLKSKYFHRGAEAHDGDDRIGYDNDTGKLWYDSNGDDRGGYKLIARLAEGLKLGASEFKVI